jgi:hypothetical protein
MAQPVFDEDKGQWAAAAAITALTDSSGGTPGDTIVDVPATYTEATLANQLSSLAVKINAIRTALINAGILATD